VPVIDARGGPARLGGQRVRITSRCVGSDRLWDADGEDALLEVDAAAQRLESRR
jgi:hypothetical protein